MSIDSLVETLTQLSISDNMTTINAAKEIAHTLRPFTGRSEHLDYFINSVDIFYNRYAASSADESLKEFVFASITSKIIDEAGDFLLCRPDLKTWADIKIALKLKFGDKTDRNVLLQQLNFLSKNKNESALEFIDKLKLLLSKINLKTQADLTLTSSTKQALIQQAESTAITVLLANVSSELRTILMIHNPKTLEDANTLVFNHSLIEQQINSRLYTTRPLTSQPTFKPKIAYQLPTFNSIPNPNFNKSQSQNQFRTNHQPNVYTPSANFNHNYNQNNSYAKFPSQPINIQPRPIKYNFPTNRQVFGKPKNVFSPENSHKPSEKPTPMSTSSRNPTIQNRHYGQRENPFLMNPHKNPITFTEITNVNDGCFTDEEQFMENPTYEQEGAYHNYYIDNPPYDYSQPYVNNHCIQYNEHPFNENPNENLSLQEPENFHIAASEDNPDQIQYPA